MHHDLSVIRKLTAYCRCYSGKNKICWNCVMCHIVLVTRYHVVLFFFFFFLLTTVTYLDATYRETTMCTCEKLEWAVWIQNQVAQAPKKGNYCENAKWASLFLGILIITECEPENLCSTINAHRLSTPKYIYIKEHNFKAAQYVCTCVCTEKELQQKCQ